MKFGGGLVFGVPRAAALQTLLLCRRSSPTFRCYSSSSDHVSFIKDVAATQPPEHLHYLLKMLQVRGETIVSPAAKQGMIPLAIPLSKNSSGLVTALLRWPTSPPGMEMPVVEVRNYGVWLLAKNVDQYIHRILVEEDAKGSGESNDELFHASGEVGKKLYEKGHFAESCSSSLEVYLLQKVGLFPDILERRVMDHFKKGDYVSAMVTGEFYTKKDHFPGFGRPFVFNADVLLKFVELLSSVSPLSWFKLVILPANLKSYLYEATCGFCRVGRNLEAKDAARGALKSPWWTLGCQYQEVANMAEWDDEQIEFIKEKVSEEGKQEDLKKGKEAAQISLDEAAFLLDLASVEGTWDELRERIAECYKEGGLPEIANFVTYQD